MYPTTTAKSAFKKAQAHYRRRPTEPDHVDDLSEMIDFLQSENDSRIIRIEVSALDNDASCDFYYSGPLFGLKDYPGFLFAPAALSPDLQDALAISAVRTYCEAPHKTNIDAVPPKPLETESNRSMWELWKSERERTTAVAEQTAYYRSFRKLAWASLGYHYDWTERAYHQDAWSLMPVELLNLGKLFARTAFRIQNDAASSPETLLDPTESNTMMIENNDNNVGDFQATACIVNFYNHKSVMGGHRDDSEKALSKPIVSVSLGRPAVFLLGGKSLDCEPVLPMILRPGDVMIMGGDCRLNYHSMARLLPRQLPTPWDAAATENASMDNRQHQVKLEAIFRDRMVRMSEQDRSALREFLLEHRININVRQVW